MPPKKRKGRPTSSAEMYAALDALQLSSDEISPGAVEALRLLHVAFLSRITSELAQLGKKDEQLTIQPKHVNECLEKMGFSDYVEELGSNDDKKVAATGRKKISKKRTKWSADMEAEQERLLAQSKVTVQKQQQEQKQS